MNLSSEQRKKLLSALLESMTFEEKSAAVNSIQYESSLLRYAKQKGVELDKHDIAWFMEDPQNRELLVIKGEDFQSVFYNDFADREEKARLHFLSTLVSHRISDTEIQAFLFSICGNHLTANTIDSVDYSGFSFFISADSWKAK